MGAELVFRALGDDIDDTGRGIGTEQRALRAAQHFDALDLAEIAEADAVTGARHAVDDDTDGGFQTGIVTHGTDAADAGGRLELVRGRGDVQARRDNGEVFQVANAGVGEEFLAVGRNGDRNVLDAFFAFLGRDGDDVDRAAFILGRGVTGRQRSRRGGGEQNRALGE